MILYQELENLRIFIFSNSQILDKTKLDYPPEGK